VAPPPAVHRIGDRSAYAQHESGPPAFRDTHQPPEGPNGGVRIGPNLLHPRPRLFGAEGRAIIAARDDGVYRQTWTLEAGGVAKFTASKDAIRRRFVMNHLIHHGGQLTVVLRLAGAKVPQTFGPTADEPDA